MSVYYNEFDPFAAAWLRELIKEGVIPDGEVDQRDMRDVDPKEIRGFTQYHFFAGIGGWAYALRLAGWPDDWSVLTGSPPCQPFSVAGKRLGVKDERHLAPKFIEFVRELKVPVIFGEQVANAVTKDEWLDNLFDDLEREGYTTGAFVLPACSVGAPHIRQRLWFTGVRVVDSDSERQYREQIQLQSREKDAQSDEIAGRSNVSWMGDTELYGSFAIEKFGRKEKEGRLLESERSSFIFDECASDSGLDGAWSNAEWLYCRDGKFRPTPLEPSLFPLVDGVPNRVGILRGAGNAIVPQVGAEVVRAVKEWLMGVAA